MVLICCCCRRIIGVLKDDRVRGILLLRNDSDTSDQKRLDIGFSEDAFCPNEQFGTVF